MPLQESASDHHAPGQQGPLKRNKEKQSQGDALAGLSHEDQRLYTARLGTCSPKCMHTYWDPALIMLGSGNLKTKPTGPNGVGF
ncbi:hypothetical protein EOD39_21644 [Acipenser ruthenus]|uniref:Uncharacterized protein n=1 Tax=Acipenser ruthenus TaxID=7906 RepID=A0A444US50_ACIRT|nr:hypothetical protein EOD39_21644 [Acipenser ruthenus]